MLRGGKLTKRVKNTSKFILLAFACHFTGKIHFVLLNCNDLWHFYATIIKEGFMKKTIGIASFIAVLAMACVSASAQAWFFDSSVKTQPAPASDIQPDETPLMVIRFNESHVAYARPLYDTLNSALQAKPTARFEVVSVAPRAHNPDNQPKYDQVASANTEKVMKILHQIGMPDSRITLISANDAVNSTEVRIYVR